MSQENVEIVQKVYRLAEAEGVDGLLELATEEIVWISDPRFPGGGIHKGKENVRQWLMTLWIYDEMSIDVERIMDLDDRVLGITHFHAVSRDGPKVSWLWCHLFSFRNGLICRTQSFLDRESALEAVGLSELDAHAES